MASVQTHLAENPFFVLELPFDASRVEMERQGHKLLSLMELGVAGAAQYATPLGAQPRTAELVRWSMAELRDPNRRLHHELWCHAEVHEGGPAPTEEAEPCHRRHDALTRAGWRQPA